MCCIQLFSQSLKLRFLCPLLLENLLELFRMLDYFIQNLFANHFAKVKANLDHQSQLKVFWILFLSILIFGFDYEVNLKFFNFFYILNIQINFESYLLLTYLNLNSKILAGIYLMFWCLKLNFISYSHFLLIIQNIIINLTLSHFIFNLEKEQCFIL